MNKSRISSSRCLSERPYSTASQPISIPIVVTANENDDGDGDGDGDDDDDVFVALEGKENAGEARSRRKKRVRSSKGNPEGDKLFPSLSNLSTSRSPVRSLCVSHSPGRREILRNGLCSGSTNCPSSAASRSDSAVSGGRGGGSAPGKVKILGKGSFGSVVLGEWQGRRVAVKLIRAGERCRSESVVSESNAIGIVHRNIVRVHGIFRDDDAKSGDGDGGCGATMVVMEYVGQSNLQRLLDTMPERIDETFVIRCFKDIARALAYLHSTHLVHLDVKPSNIFVTSGGHCKLGDFGCSRRLASSSSSSRETAATSSSSSLSLLIGTSGYQAPELLSSGAVSDRCDVYSYGVLLWQVLHSGETPFAGSHPHVVVYQVVSMQRRPESRPAANGGGHRPSSLLPASAAFSSSQLVALYRECWTQEAPARPTMKEVLRRLDKISSSPKSSSTSSTRRKSTALRI